MIPSINYSQIRFRLNSEYLTITIVCTVVLFGVDMVLRTSEKEEAFILLLFSAFQITIQLDILGTFTLTHILQSIYIYILKKSKLTKSSLKLWYTPLDVILFINFSSLYVNTNFPISLLWTFKMIIKTLCVK